MAGEDEWFEAEVLSYDEATKLHYVRYAADGFESSESLMGGPDACPWRRLVTPTGQQGGPAAAHIAATASEERPQQAGGGDDEGAHGGAAGRKRKRAHRRKS